MYTLTFICNICELFVITKIPLSKKTKKMGTENASYNGDWVHGRPGQENVPPPTYQTAVYGSDPPVINQVLP